MFDRESNELKIERQRGTEGRGGKAASFFPLLPRSRSHKHGQGTTPMRAREMWIAGIAVRPCCAFRIKGCLHCPSPLGVLEWDDSFHSPTRAREPVARG